jgi:adenylylsulfate kinase-like enzyme
MPDTGAGAVVWITGLSGAGKSTIARAALALVQPRAPHAVLVDGDEFRRRSIGRHGHDTAGRLANAYAIARHCAAISAAGALALCATMSLFAEVRAWNRRHVARYLEVYVRAPLALLERRDPLGLYGRAREGREQHVVGVDLPFEEPEAPDLVLDNAEPSIDPGALARRIVDRLEAMGVLT